MVFEFLFLVSTCTSGVPAPTLGALVSAESDFNPYAIGVVRGSISRQPASLSEAIDTVNRLESAGYNYSVGLAQINKVNFDKHNLSSTSMFDPCQNLAAGSEILSNCFLSAGQIEPAEKLRAALSCYYSGTHNTDRYSGYIDRVVGRSFIDFGKITIDVSDQWNVSLKPIEIKSLKGVPVDSVKPSRWNTSSPMVIGPVSREDNNPVILLGDEHRINSQ